MNLKVVNLVAIQFGMFVGILSWLAYSQIPFGEPRAAAKVRKPVAEPVSTFASASNPAEQRSQTVDYPGDQERTQPVAEPPAPAMQHEYSAAAVQQNSALAAQLYYQQIAPRRYASSGVGSGYVTTDAPAYAQVAQEPAVVQTDDPVPETVAYVQPTQVVVYPQPQFVVFNNSRRFANRCRPTSPVRGAHIANTHRRPDRRRSHLISSIVPPPPRSFGVMHRRNDRTPSCRPNHKFAARGRR